LNDTRTLVLGMDAQVFWRFLDLSGYPIEICRMVDPASRLTQTPQDVADKVYEANECDVDEHLVGKARQLFPSAKAMAEDKDFLAMLRGFVRIATCDSMQLSDCYLSSHLLLPQAMRKLHRRSASCPLGC
jgi:hypothetical protein